MLWPDRGRFDYKMQTYVDRHPSKCISCASQKVDSLASAFILKYKVVSPRSGLEMPLISYTLMSSATQAKKSGVLRPLYVTNITASSKISDLF